VTIDSAPYVSRVSTPTAPPAARTIDDVFLRLAAPVHNYLKASRVEDSENLLGDVFADVMRGLPRFVGDDRALRSWVFTIAHHRVVDEQRRAARRRRMLRAVRAEEREPSSETLTDSDLLAALDTLTFDQREVVVLRFVADLSLETVAALTKRTTGAVKALQHRALRNLGATLSGDGL
jgi:RNA polymerase sigma-70 factor (ECF subfamily)